MPYILFYDPTTSAVEQIFVPNGSPIDREAGRLGIIAMSMDTFPGMTSEPDPIPPEPEPEPPEPPEVEPPDTEIPPVEPPA